MKDTGRKKFNLFILIFSIFLMLSIGLGLSSTISYADAEMSISEDNKKSYCSATLEDEFADDTIIVVLTNEASNSGYSYTVDDFKDIDCCRVKDLTAGIQESVSYNKDTYNKILQLTLSSHGKENVLRSIKTLEKRDDIKSAEPNYIETYCEVLPNDSFETAQWAIDYGRFNEIDFCAIYSSNCIAEGTLITLADGSQKAVEDLTGNENLLVWNLNTGTFDSAPILFIDREEKASYEVIQLSFSDGTIVDVISEHGFWDVDLNEYVYLDKYAAEYIGHCFLKQGEDGMTAVTLVDVEVSTKVTSAYSPVTYGHLCYYVNGMLSMPGGIDGLFNIFEVDKETMMYDAEAMAADIAQYGLYTYEEFNALYNVPEVMFDACGGQYLKVALGKGLITEEGLQNLIDRYSVFFAE